MLSKNELISFFILLSISSIFSSSAEAIQIPGATKQNSASFSSSAEAVTIPVATMQGKNSASFSSSAEAVTIPGATMQDKNSASFSSSANPVSVAEINDIFSSLDALRTNPHARDGQVPQMVALLVQACQEQYPQWLLLPKGDIIRYFLSKAEAAGTIASGSHGAGRLLVELLKKRFDAIPQHFLDATIEILQRCIALSQIAGDEELKTLLDLSVQKDGTDSALYGAFLLYASSALSGLMEERTRQGNSAAEAAAVYSSNLLGAGGGAYGQFSEEEELSLALAMSLMDLQKSTR